jgi:hypothetical protein
MKRPLAIALKLTFVLAAGLVVNACKNQKSSLPDAGQTGVYALVSIDGNQVPANVFHEGTALQVRSGTFTINSDGTCSTKTIFVPPAGSEVTRMVYATYVKDGSRLNMQWKGAGKTVGNIEGNTFTMNNEGMVFVYTK